jgi:hypothetical protein
MSKRVKYTYQVETIDAKKARQYLSNVHVRQKGRDFKGVIQTYADAMKNGTWDTDVAQTISFDNTGALIDGWHRLHAVELANVSLPFLVARNVEPHAFAHYDAGKARSLAFRRGVENNRQAIIGALIRTALYPYGTSRHTVEQSEVTENFAREYLDYFDEHATSTNKARVSTASCRAGVILSLMAHPDRKSTIIYAYNDMIHGNFEKAPRSVSNLYRRCLEDKRLTNMDYVALAWHAFNPYKFGNLKLVVRDLSSDIHDIQNKVLKDLKGAIQ